LGPTHPDTMNTLSNLSTFLSRRGAFEEAEASAREALDRRLQVYGPNHPKTLVSFNVMGFVYRKQGKNAEAEPYLRQALEASAVVLGVDHPDRIIYLINMGTLLSNLDRTVEAEEHFREAIERSERTLGPEHYLAVAARSTLGDHLLSQERYVDAIDVLEPAVPAARVTYATANEASLAVILYRLGRARRGAGRFEGAETALLEAHESLERLRGPEYSDTRDCVQALAELYDAWGESIGDDELRRRADTWRSRLETTPAGSDP
ncbi:MAG: tetratricopeptide repeat protein, partial [Phycisphaerales bacterium]|nr:tetratricopeptide repeat protein [Phycisphaerales bacterium]